MAGYVLIGTLAAFGILCCIWVIFWWLLPGGRGGVMVCLATPGFPERPFVERYLFLVESGMIRCVLIIVDLGLEEQDRRWLRQLGGRVEICKLEEISSRLELERNGFE